MITEQLESRIEEIPVTEVPENYVNATRGILSWLLTKDHKRIGILYLISVTVMFSSAGLRLRWHG